MAKSLFSISVANHTGSTSLMHKLLLVGNWAWQIYESSFSDALRRHDVEVEPVVVGEYLSGFFGKLQKKIPIMSLSIIKLNRELVKKVADGKYDTLFLWRCVHIFPSTVVRIRKLGCKVVTFNNDDPFGPKTSVPVPWHHHLLWFWYLRTLKVANINLFYRPINVKEAKSYGASHADTLLPYFVPWKDREVPLSSEECSIYNSDFTFIGHYEPDGRANAALRLHKEGFSVKIWGDRSWYDITNREFSETFPCILPVYGERYSKALSGASVCLCFLSKLNRDTYTRRCFEIPATRRVLLTERTTDLEKMFEEDKEACFFSTEEELVKKAHWLMSDKDRRERIAQAGYERVWRDGHDVDTRAVEFIEEISP